MYETDRRSFRPLDALDRNYDDGPAGMDLWGMLPEMDQELLRDAHGESLARMSTEWQQSLQRKQTFWVNLYQRSGGGEKVAIGRIDEVDRFSRQLVNLVYGEGEVAVDGYGWIVNPAGSQAQDWHVDYSLDYSTIFIPLTRLTEFNCLQYAVLPPDLEPALKARAFADLDRVDLDLLCRESEWVSIRQLVARPFSVIRLNFETIHRGVANTGGYDRVLFWISVKKGEELLPVAPLIERIELEPQNARG